MNSLKLILFGCMCLLSIESNSQCHSDYQLYWSDEFDLTAVDVNKWVIKQGGGGFGNQEVQYYQPENATVSDGLLHIKLANETVVDGSSTYNYTSAKLETASKVNFLYGRVEARIKMPDVVGSWPAFWMLGSDIGTVGWPHCGEIDIVEWVGRGPNAAAGSIFFDGTWPDNHLTTSYTIPPGQSFIADFHTFAVEWEPNEIRYYCDGNHYATYKNTTIAPKNLYFNHEFFIILNCAIGGSGGGSVINIVDPKFMEIDYVRVYSLPETAASINLTGPTALMSSKQNVLFSTAYFPNTTYNWTLPNGATIADGGGSNAIHVNFTGQGGKVKVTATNSCGTLADSLSVNLLTDNCTIVYDDFDGIKNVNFTSNGTLVEQFMNPSVDAKNPSAYVAQYQRDVNETYDVLAINDMALESASIYENSTRVFFMDLYTSAPLGTQVTLQLESSALNGGAYPQGRRSSYIGTATKQNQWHTVRFTFNQIINSATLPDQVDHIALLFDPGHKTGDVYYIDNFRRLKDAPECDPITTGIYDLKTDVKLAIYPNPVTTILTIPFQDESQSFSIYNYLGEKVLEDKGAHANVGHLSNGMYFLRIEGKTLKFIKQ